MNLIERPKLDRVIFDPANKAHIEEYRFFVVNGRWKSGCPFFLDWPYLTIPDMIKDRITKRILKIA